MGCKCMNGFWEANMEQYLKSYFRERVFPKVQLNFNVVFWITSLLILFIFHTYCVFFTTEPHFSRWIRKCQNDNNRTPFFQVDKEMSKRHRFRKPLTKKNE